MDHYCTIYYDAIDSWASYRGSTIGVKHEIKSDFEHLRKLPYSDNETGKLRLSWVSIKFAIHRYIVCLYLQTLMLYLIGPLELNPPLSIFDNYGALGRDLS